MSFKPEIGKDHRTRNAQIVTGLSANARDPLYPFFGYIGKKLVVYTEDGRFHHVKHGGGPDHPLDLVRVVEGN